MKLIASIADRYSPMQFKTDQEISVEQRTLLFEAARRAASSFNEQPWRFIFAERANKSGFDLLLSLLSEYNQQWAVSASLLVVAVADEKYAQTGKHNTHAWYDTGQAVSQMVVQALSMGIQAHQMGGFDADLAVTKLNIPEGQKPVAVIAFGFPAPLNEVLPQFVERAQTPSTRREINEFVFEAGLR